MDPGTPPAVIGDLSDMLELPYVGLGEFEYKENIPGPRISSCHSQPKTYYGPITIRNYLAGYIKKLIRTHTPKTTPRYLSLFLNLPMELKLVVLEHLHPIDLYHVSKASKNMRRIVMNPKAVGVWRTAFQSYPDLPRSPPLVPEPKWAFMLFGPGICVGCGKFGALTDFAFLAQYCEVCMRANYAYPNILRDCYNRTVQPDHIAFSLLPRSYRYHGLRYTTSYINPANARYIRKDFEAMMKKVTLIQLLIDFGVPTLAEIYDEYKINVVGYLQKLDKASNVANTWANDVFRQCSAQYDKSLRQVSERCKRRLMNRGHDLIDVNVVQYSITQTLRLHNIYRLTSKAYSAVLPKLEAHVTAQKVTRLKRERQQVLEGIYEDYKKTLIPDFWQYQPPPRLVKAIAGFSGFLNADYVTRGDMRPGDAVSFFPDFATDWTKKHQLEILRLFSPAGLEPNLKMDLKRLELAMSVVTCTTCKFSNHSGRVLLGWKQICRHKSACLSVHGEPCSKFEINPIATAAATSIVVYVGLDPKTATIEDMDARNDRFMCGNCVPETSRGVTGLKVYKWSECIMHSMNMDFISLPMHTSPSWFLLTPEAARFVIEQEYAHPRPHSEVWCCNKCATHYSGCVTQKEAIDHVNRVHLTKNPLVGSDVVCDKRYYIRRRKQFRLGTDPAYELKCQRCPPLSIYKMWEKQNLLVHLRVKHHVSDPIEGEDWTRIQTITTPPQTPQTLISANIVDT